MYQYDEWAAEHYPNWYWMGYWRDGLGTIGAIEIAPRSKA